ncbi:MULTISPECIES: hypothetical protein [Prauserella]|uniref:hypothetical protein n=1 Tax=Prauserella TaxID=142577 RepID=UPI00197E8056|nr:MULTISPECIES: hypothetical protein [Prauserella]
MTALGDSCRPATAATRRRTRGSPPPTCNALLGTAELGDLLGQRDVATRCRPSPTG